MRLLAAFEDYSDAELPYVFNRHVLQHEEATTPKGNPRMSKVTCDMAMSIDGLVAGRTRAQRTRSGRV